MMWTDSRHAGITPQIVIATLYLMTRFSRSSLMRADAHWAQLVDQHLNVLLQRPEHEMGPETRAAMMAVEQGWRDWSQPIPDKGAQDDADPEAW